MFQIHLDDNKSDLSEKRQGLVLTESARDKYVSVLIRGGDNPHQSIDVCADELIAGINTLKKLEECDGNHED